jgi:septal ring factor EnvC (AmiA/AmiB activator)
MMTRRIILAIFLLLCMTPSAWPKFKEDEQKYLDAQFKAVLDQMQAMGNQVAALNAQLAELKQDQAQLQAAIIRQQHQVQDLDEMLSSLRIGNEENFSKLKTSIAELRAQTENAVSKLSSSPWRPRGLRQKSRWHAPPLLRLPGRLRRATSRPLMAPV